MMTARMRWIPLLLAALFASPACDSPHRMYALHPAATLHSAEALGPSAKRLRDLAARLEGDGVAVNPFVYGSGFLRCNRRGLDLDAGLLVDLGASEDDAAAAGKIAQFLSRVNAAARAERGPSLAYLDGFDPDSMEGRAFLSSLAADLSRVRALSAGSTDPHCYLVPLRTPGGMLVSNRLFRNTLPLGANIKFVFLADSVRYTPAEDPGVKTVTLQVFFVADIAGSRYVLSPTYRKDSRVMVPQVTAFNCLFTDKRGAFLMKGLIDPYPPGLVGLECVTQMYGGMLSSWGAGDELKCIKRAHQVFDLIGEKVEADARARFEAVLEKYLSRGEYADVALLYEVPSIARAYVGNYGPGGPLDGAFAAQFRALGNSLPRLSAAFPRVREELSRYGKTNDAIARMMQGRDAAGLAARMEESAASGRGIERALIENAELDFLLGTIARTLDGCGVSQSVTLSASGTLPFGRAMELIER